MMEVFCGGCDQFREVSEREIQRLDRGDIRFRCADCRTVNTNTTANPKVRNQ